MKIDVFKQRYKNDLNKGFHCKLPEASQACGSFERGSKHWYLK
jgi:hypothetical protein